MTSVFSWQNSISLWPASFCTPKANLPVTPGISWLPTFAFQSPMMKRTSFLVLVLECLVGIHRTAQLQLLQHLWLKHRVKLTMMLNGFTWKWTKIIKSFALKYCISYSSVDNEAYSISSKGFLFTVVDIMVIWIKFTHSSSILVHWFKKCQCSLLLSPAWQCPI